MVFNPIYVEKLEKIKQLLPIIAKGHEGNWKRWNEL